jgi:hypothetical protein
VVQSTRILFVYPSVFLAVSLATAQANAAACLDHSHSVTASGAPNDARSGAKRHWAATVKADDGAKWAVLNNARNTKLSCTVKDPKVGLNVCTLTATPCQR